MILQALHCSHCHGTDIVRHGQARQGKQRYRCREYRCAGRTFLGIFAQPPSCHAGHEAGWAKIPNLVPYQRRAKHAGQCGVEVEGGRVPTHDWFLNVQILTSGGLR